jgi:uncharacterized MAPEG superfamily protein
MTPAHICIAAAILTPYVFTSVAKFSRAGFGLAENRNPRDWLASLDGYRKRAHFAQQNGFEVVPAFSAAVLVAQQVGHAPQAMIDGLAIAFVASRLLYGVCYVADWGVLRTIVWFAGATCIARLFIISM